MKQLDYFKKRIAAKRLKKSFCRVQGQFFQKGGWHPQPIHGQPDAFLSGASSQKFAEKTKFHKVLVKSAPGRRR